MNIKRKMAKPGPVRSQRPGGELSLELKASVWETLKSDKHAEPVFYRLDFYCQRLEVDLRSRCF